MSREQIPSKILFSALNLSKLAAYFLTNMAAGAVRIVNLISASCTLPVNQPWLGGNGFGKVTIAAKASILVGSPDSSAFAARNERSIVTTNPGRHVSLPARGHKARVE